MQKKFGFFEKKKIDKLRKLNGIERFNYLCELTNSIQPSRVIEYAVEANCENMFCAACLYSSDVNNYNYIIDLFDYYSEYQEAMEDLVKYAVAGASDTGIEYVVKNVMLRVADYDSSELLETLEGALIKAKQNEALKKYLECFFMTRVITNGTQRVIENHSLVNVAHYAGKCDDRELISKMLDTDLRYYDSATLKEVFDAFFSRKEKEDNFVDDECFDEDLRTKIIYPILDGTKISYGQEQIDELRRPKKQNMTSLMTTMLHSIIEQKNVPAAYKMYVEMKIWLSLSALKELEKVVMTYGTEEEKDKFINHPYTLKLTNTK